MLPNGGAPPSTKSGRSLNAVCKAHQGCGWRWRFTRKSATDTLGPVKTTLLEPEIVTRKGKPVSVILPIAAFEELLERVEDAEDIAWLKRARKKPQHYRPLEDYLAERRGH